MTRDGARHGRADQFGDRIVRGRRQSARRPRSDGVTRRGALPPTGRCRWPGRGAAFGCLRRGRIGEKWRRMCARLQENRVDDDDEARRAGAEYRQRIDRPARRFRQQPKSDRSDGAEQPRRAEAKLARCRCGAHALFFTRMLVGGRPLRARAAARNGPLRHSAAPVKGSASRWSRRCAEGCLSEASALAIERQAHGDARAFADPAADRDLAAMQPDQTFDNGEAEPGAAVTTVVGCARLKIWLADPRADPRRRCRRRCRRPRK